MVRPWLELVRVPPSGTWEQRRAHLFQTAERWVGPEDVGGTMRSIISCAATSPRTGQRRARDIAPWAGMKPRDVAPAWSRLVLRRFRDEDGRRAPRPSARPLPHPDTPAPVRFLPTWDAVLLVHARRTGVLPEEYRPRIFPTTMPQSVGTFLVDGVVAGTWRFEDGRVRWEPSAGSIARPGARSTTRPSGLRCSTPGPTMAP